jgi:hypothetical protein
MGPAVPQDLLRPRDLALLLLASRDLLPRKRARDQQADLAGLQLKRDMLSRLAALDPDPPPSTELEAALVRIVEEIGTPTGPARAIAVSIREDWEAASTTPEWVAYLLDDAMRETREERRGGRVPS